MSPRCKLHPFLIFNRGSSIRGKKHGNRVSKHPAQKPRKHQWAHAGRFPKHGAFACGKCMRSFRLRTHLRNHMEEYHESKLAVLEREVEKFKAEIKEKRTR